MITVIIEKFPYEMYFKGEMMEYKFASENDFDDLHEFLLFPDLDYLFYQRWVEKTVEELGREDKKAFIASENDIIGDIIFQDEEFYNILEIKNIYVLESFRGEGVFSRIYDMAEKYSLSKNFEGMRCDGLSRKEDVIDVLKYKGFESFLVHEEKGFEEKILLKNF